MFKLPSHINILCNVYNDLSSLQSQSLSIKKEDKVYVLLYVSYIPITDGNRNTLPSTVKIAIQK